MSTVYGAQVINETLNVEYHTTQGETPNLNAKVYLADPLVVREGFDSLDYPGQLEPATLQFSLHAKTAKDVPAWTPGHVVRARVAMPDGWAGDWSTTDPDDPARPPEWVNNRFVITDADATPVASGVLVTYTCVDILAALQALPLTMTRAAEDWYHRAQAVTDTLVALPGWWVIDFTIDAVGRKVDLLLSDITTVESNGWTGPYSVTDTPLGDVLRTLANSTLDGITQPNADGRHRYLVANVCNTDPTLSGGGDDLALAWAHLVRHAADMATAYRLTSAGTRTPRTPNPTHATGGTMRNVIIDACHVRLAGLSWRHVRGTNTVVLNTIKADGSPGSRQTQHVDIARQRGVQTRTLDSQASDDGTFENHKPAIGAFHLGSREAAQPGWRPTAVVIDTKHIAAGELAALAQALRFTPGLGAAGRLTAQLTVFNVDPSWGFSGDHLAGTIVATTVTIAGGALTVEADLVPELPELTGASGPGLTASYAQLAADPGLAALRYQDIDPTLTYADFQLIGV